MNSGVFLKMNSVTKGQQPMRFNWVTSLSGKSMHWRIQGGGRQGRPPGPNIFIFVQFSAKKLKNNSTFGNWRTPWGKSWIRHCNVLALNQQVTVTRHDL